LNRRRCVLVHSLLKVLSLMMEVGADLPHMHIPAHTTAHVCPYITPPQTHMQSNQRLVDCLAGAPRGSLPLA
jgi:hypothetical protein